MTHRNTYNSRTKIDSCGLQNEREFIHRLDIFKINYTNGDSRALCCLSHYKIIMLTLYGVKVPDGTIYDFSGNSINCPLIKNYIYTSRPTNDGIVGSASRVKYSTCRNDHAIGLISEISESGAAFNPRPKTAESFNKKQRRILFTRLHDG